MFLRKRRKNENGSVQVVEAAYVFPIMFFILLILIYMGNAFFIRAQVDAVAETYAIKGAEFCSDSLLAILEDTGTLPSVNELNTQPYRYLIDNMGDVEDGVADSVWQELTSSTTFFRNMKPDFSPENVVADYENYILYQTFSVDISYRIKIPLKMLWEKDFFVIDITSHAIAPVNDTAEFVRNADMVVDLMQGTKIGESISKTFKKVNNFVSNFASKSSTKQETTRAQVASVSPTSGIVASGGTGSGSGAGGGTGGGSGAENTGIVEDGWAQTGTDTGTSGEGEGSDEEEEPPSEIGGVSAGEEDEQKEHSGYYSSYDDRMQQTPADGPRGKWTKERGESTYIPTDENVKALLAGYGQEGITYTNAIPDFSAVSKLTVTIDSMSESRPKNFGQCNELCAAIWNQQCYEGKSDWTASSVKKWCEENHYTWHERNDMETCDLVPSAINKYFGHLGGVSECEKKEESEKTD